MINKNFPSREYELIDTLQGILGFQTNPAYVVGIGDDAAIRHSSGKETLIITTDVSVEDVHFSLSTVSLQEIGYKAMVTNLSDCAAMGAIPDSAVVALTFPASLPNLKDSIAEIYSGFAEACSTWNFPIVGGDLSSGKQWVLSITLIGKSAENSRVIKRVGAMDGDLLWVSGFPGRSCAGLAVLQKYGRIRGSEFYDRIIDWHIRPVPRIKAGLELAKQAAVHAMMDLSDGLSKDCRTLSYENNLGIILNFDSLRIPEDMVKLSTELTAPVKEWMLHGGEDYELLFATSSDFDPSSIPHQYCGGLECIGKFSKDYDGVFLQKDGQIESVPVGSWDHIANFS